MSASHQLVSELLRPQQLGDLTLPKRIIDRLQRMIETDSVMNMLFHGEPGLGQDDRRTAHRKSKWRGRLLRD